MMPLRLLSAAACLLGTVHARDFDWANFAGRAADLQTLLSASVEGTQARLTASEPNNLGVIYYQNEQQYVEAGFATSFVYNINSDPLPGQGKEGFTFLVQTEALNAIGGNDGGLGYASSQGTPIGIRDSIAIEFDIDMDALCADPDGNHISVHTRGAGNENSANEDSSIAIALDAVVPQLDDGADHTVDIEYVPPSGLEPDAQGVLTVSLDSVEYINTPLRLTDQVALTRGRAWVGFSASTGPDNVAEHILKSWSFTQGVSLTVPADCRSDGVNENTQGGVQETFTVQLVDANGYDLTEDPKDSVVVSATLTGPDTISPVATANDDGTYTLTYTPLSPGSYALSILVNGAAISNGEYTVTNVVGPADPQSCVLQNVQNTTQTGVDTTFNIQARDRAGNDLTTGGLSFNVAFGSPNVTVDVSYVSAGRYLVTYSSQDAGDYTLTVNLDGIPVQGSPQPITVTPNAAFAGQCTAVGTGLTQAVSGVQASFIITTRDEFGNLITTGGLAARFTALASSPGFIDASFVDFEDGTYRGSYTAVEAGTYSPFNVRLDASNIADSPFTLVVTPGAANAGQSEASGEGLTQGTAGEGQTASVQAKDVNGNAIAVGGENFECEITSGPGIVTCDVTDNGTGVYSVSYNATLRGDYTLAIRLDGLNIQGSPFSPYISASPVVDVTQSQVTGPTQIGAGVNTPFTLTTRDRFGNQLDAGGQAASIAASLVGPPNYVATVQDDADGTYQLFVAPEVIGSYTSEVTFNSNAVPGSGATVTVVPGPASAPDCQISGAGTTNAVAGEEAAYTITAFDRFGNRINEGGLTGFTIEFEQTVTGPGGQVVDNGDGTYSATYTIETPAGGLGLLTLLDNDRTADSPSPLTLAPAALDATQTTASGAVGGFAIIAGDQQAVGLQGRDRFGNPTSESGLNTTLSYSGPETGTDPAPVDNGDGTYSLAYRVTTIGTYTLDITADGGAVQNSPFTVTCNSAPANTGSTVEGDGASEAFAGEDTSFTIQGVDEFDNTCNTGGDTFTVTAEPASLTIGDVVDLGNGRYTVTYSGTVKGVYALTVEVNGVEINASPLSVNLRGNPLPDPSLTVVSGPGIDSAVSGQPAQVTITPRDQYDNEIDLGGFGGDFTLTLTDGSGGVVDGFVNDDGSGVYTATYTAQLAGPYNFVCQFQGTTVSNGARSVIVSPGALNPGTSTAAGVGLQGGPVNLALSFVVQGRDAAGNPVSPGGPSATVTTFLDGPAPVSTPQTVDNGDGTYTVTYTATAVGAYDVTIQMDSTTISGTYRTLIGASLPDPARTQVAGPGLTGGDVAVPTSFTFTAFDRDNNPIEHGGWPQAFGVALVDGNGDTIAEGIIDDNDDGTYEATYVTTRAGSFSLLVTADGGNVNGSPFPVTLNPGALDTARTVVTAAEAAPLGGTVSFELQAVDVFRNPVVDNSLVFTATLTGPPSPGEPRSSSGSGSGSGSSTAKRNTVLTGTLESEGQGKYTMSFDTAGSPQGEYVADVRFNAIPIEESGFSITLQVPPEEDSGLSTAALTGIIVGSIVVFFVLVWCYCKRKRSRSGDHYLDIDHHAITSVDRLM